MATFAPARLHSGSLSWLYICLRDTTTKCHAGASYASVSSPRVVVPGREFHSSTKSRNGILWTRNDKIRDANFPHLQSMAELRRNQRGEIWRQHVKAHSCSHFSPCFDHTSLTQTDDGTSQIDHDIGAYVPVSFRTMSRVLLRPHPTGVQGWRRQDQQLNLIAQWRDHLYWERSFTASMISPVF